MWLSPCPRCVLSLGVPGNFLSLQQYRWKVKQNKHPAFNSHRSVLGSYEEQPSKCLHVLCTCCWYWSWNKTSKIPIQLAEKKETEKCNYLHHNFLSHIWVISVLENNSLDWVFIPTDIAGEMFEENELWMLQQWFVITFICSKSYFFCDATDAYAVSSFCLGQFSLNNCQLHSLLGCSFVFLYFANELWWLDLVKSFLQS